MPGSQVKEPMTSTSSEKKIWDQTAEMHGNFSVPLSRKISAQFIDRPTEIVALLSRYKFSAKLGAKKGHILEIGCGSGFGAPILGEFADSYLGIDEDGDEIESAQNNLSPPKFHFARSTFIGQKFRLFDGIISITATPLNQNRFEPFLKTILENLNENGIIVLGYKNALDFDIHPILGNLFHQTFLFSMNQEILFSGHSNHSEYCFCVSFHRKSYE